MARLAIESALRLMRCHYHLQASTSDDVMNICTIKECQQPQKTKTLCLRHYNKQYHEMRRKTPGFVSSSGKCLRWIDAHVNYDNNDCIVWPYARTKAGYPNMKYKGGYIVASRLMCIKAHGYPSSECYQAAHSCGGGHKGCMNPNHLSWKTPKENEADKVVHGTKLYGESCSFSKLTWSKVDQIRADRLIMSGVDTVRKNGVATQCVSRIHLNQR